MFSRNLAYDLNLPKITPQLKHILVIFNIVVSTCFKKIRKCFNLFQNEAWLALWDALPDFTFIQNEAFSHLSKFI